MFYFCGKFSLFTMKRYLLSLIFLCSLGISAVWADTMTETPLTFEAMVGGATVTYTLNGSKPIQYSLNGGAWTDYTSAITLDNVGDIPWLWMLLLCVLYAVVGWKTKYGEYKKVG